MSDFLLWLLAVPVVVSFPFWFFKLAGYLTRNSLVLAALLVTTVPAASVFMLRQGAISGTQAVFYAGLGGAASIGVCLLRALGRPAPPVTAAGVVLLFPFVELVSAALNDQLQFTISSLGSVVTIFAGPLLAFWALFQLSRQQIATMTLVAGGALIAASYVSEVVAPSGAPSSEARFGLATDLGRLSGVTTNPNALGAVALGFGLVALSSTKGMTRILLVAAAVPPIVLSQQRAAVLGIVLGILAGFYYRQKFLAVAGGIAAVAAALLVTPSWSLFGASTTTDDTTVQSRFVIWHYVRDNWSDAVLYGWGPQGLRERSIAAGLPEAYSHAHNQVINGLAVGGLLLLLVILILIARMVLRLLRAAPELRGQQFVLVAGIAPLLFFESPLQTGMNPLTQPQVALVWLVVAVALAPLASKRDDSGGATATSAVAHA